MKRKNKMLHAKAATVTVELHTGRLSLTADDDRDILELCDVAARANPKRGFLIVSKILGRHLPARPAAMRGAMDRLGAMIPSDLPQPVVILGMAETATALGQGVFAAYRRLNPGVETIYLQTSRQRVPDSYQFASFEEGHSHATTHVVQVRCPEILATVQSARALVIVDDECSTGGTFIACADAMCAVMPGLENIATCCITDWSGGAYLPSMPIASNRFALLRGAMAWTPNPASAPVSLAQGSNEHGRAPSSGMRSRTGISEPDRAARSRFAPRRGERVLVLGEGEHSYEALLFAEEMERAGAVAAVQCITRSPAVLGHAMQSQSKFGDSYGSGAPCYLYNLLRHDPDRIAILCEVAGDQLVELNAALAELGATVPAIQLICTYDGAQ